MKTANRDNLDEIKVLVGLAESKTPEQREFLYERIGEFLITDHKTFSNSEKEIMADIIYRITADVEKSIRANFAKNLAQKRDIPKALMIFLANDEIEVALPILRDCGLLAENDLLEIIMHRSKQHRLAVAARDNISAQVCSALCNLDDTDITVTVIQNETAQISMDLLTQICMQSEFMTEYQRPLLERPFLPKPIAEKMYRWVSMSLREHICEKFDIDARLLEVDIHDREQTIDRISDDSDPSLRLVEKLHKSGDLSTRFLIKSLNQGEIDLFEFAFAKLLDMDIEKVRYFIYAENPEIIAVACRSLNIDRVIFKSIYDLTASIRDKNASILSPAVSAPMDLYDLLSEEAATSALRNDDFTTGKVRYAAAC
ncbi:DUF2336 domain-containing protein [uncultured Sneathiella sp.]|jgi:uncharacterized protein (DUF2336 family)|uniref:DUF2336 domain-containing protein n=1 Tax=uncultured Sneathiella sp. TaxID=879315 RepID=UPI0030D903B5|tara:strand:- start:1646 stop:2758 length:1113 start_codon:yes stop_codon:yes gene_type:complete